MPPQVVNVSRANSLDDYVTMESLRQEYDSLPDSERTRFYDNDFESYVNNRRTHFENMVGYGYINPDTLKPLPSSPASPTPEPIRYLSNGEMYDIPPEMRERFLAKHPEAEVTTRFGVDSEMYDIPQSKLGVFKKRHPKAVALNRDGSVSETQLSEELLTNEMRRITNNPTDTIDISPVMRDIPDLSEAERDAVTGAGGAFARSALSATPETAGAIGGGMAGMKVGALAGGTLGPVGALAGGLIGMLVGGFIGAKTGQAVEDAVAPVIFGEDAYTRMQEKLAQDVEAHPMASLAGQIAPQMLVMKPSPSNVRQAWRFMRQFNKLPKGEKIATVTTTSAGKANLNNAINVLFGAGTEGAVETVHQIERGNFDPLRLGFAISAGAVLNDPNRFGRAIGFEPTPKDIGDLKAIEKSGGLKSAKDLAMEGKSPEKVKAVSDESLVYGAEEPSVPQEGMGVVDKPHGGTTSDLRPKTQLEMAHREILDPNKSGTYTAEEVLTASESVNRRVSSLSENIEVKKSNIDALDGQIEGAEIARKEINSLKLSDAEDAEILLEKYGISNGKEKNTVKKKYTNDIKAYKAEKGRIGGEISQARKAIKEEIVYKEQVRQEVERFGGEKEITIQQKVDADTSDIVNRHTALKAKEDALMAEYQRLANDDPRKDVLARQLQENSEEMNRLADENPEWVESGEFTHQRGVERRASREATDPPTPLLPKDTHVGIGSYVRVGNVGKHGGKKGNVVKVYKNNNVRVKFDDGSTGSIPMLELEPVSRRVRPDRTKRGQIHIDPKSKHLTKGLKDLKDEGKMGEATGERVVMEGDRDMGAEPAHRVPMERETPAYSDIPDTFKRQEDGSWSGQVGNRTYNIIRMKADKIHEGSGYVWYDLDSARYLGRTKKEAIRTLQQVKDEPLRGVAYDSPKNIEGQEITGVAREEGVLSEKPFSIERGRERTIDRVFKSVDGYIEKGSAPASHRRDISKLKSYISTMSKKLGLYEADPMFNPNDNTYVRQRKSIDDAIARLEELTNIEHMSASTFGLEFTPQARRIFDWVEGVVSKHGKKGVSKRLDAMNRRERELLEQYRLRKDPKIEQELDSLSDIRKQIIDEEAGRIPMEAFDKGKISPETPSKTDVGLIRGFAQKLTPSFLKQAQHRSNNPYYQSIIRILSRADETKHRIMGYHYEPLRKFKLGSVFFRNKASRRERIAEILEKGITRPEKSGDKKLIKIANIMRKAYERMYSDAIDIGIKVAGKIENYFPRMMNRETAEAFYKEMDNVLKSYKELRGSEDLADDDLLELIIQKQFTSVKDAIGQSVAKSIAKKRLKSWESMMGAFKYMIETGQADSLAGAYRRLRNYTGDDIFRPFGNLEKSRQLKLPMEIWERDAVAVFDRYLRSFSTRYAEAKHFGVDYSGFTKNHELLMLEDGSLANKVEMMVQAWNGEIYRNKYIGESARTAKRLTAGVTAFEVGTKIGMGFATIPNIFQTLYSVWTRVGTSTYLKGVAKSIFSKSFRSEMRQSGIVIDDAMKAMSNVEYDGKMQKFSNLMLTLNGFKFVNKMNNYISASSAKHLVEKLYKQASSGGRKAERAKKALRRYGFNYAKQPSDERMANFMYRFATDTQLLGSVARDPIMFHDPRYQWMFLFKKFGVRQVQLIKDDMMHLWTSGEKAEMMAYATRLAVATYGSYHGVKAIRDWAKQLFGPQADYSNIPDDDMEMFLEVLSTAGSLGIIGDMLATGYSADRNKLSLLARTFTPVQAETLIDAVGTANSFVNDVGPYSFKGAVRRTTTRAVGNFAGSIGYYFSENLQTPKQRKEFTKRRKGQYRKRIFEAFINNDVDHAVNLWTQYNMNFPDNMLRWEDISVDKLAKYIKDNIEKEFNY